MNKSFLNNVSYSLVDAFVIRQNDIDGYWALGIICKDTVEQGMDTVDFDVLDLKSSPSFWYSKRLLYPLRKRLYDAFDKKGLKYEDIVSVTIRVEFIRVAPSEKNLKSIDLSRILPTICTAKILTNQGVERNSSLEFLCRPHDPAKEMRSTRRW